MTSTVNNQSQVLFTWKQILWKVVDNLSHSALSTDWLISDFGLARRIDMTYNFFRLCSYRIMLCCNCMKPPPEPPWIPYLTCSSIRARVESFWWMRVLPSFHIKLLTTNVAEHSVLKFHMTQLMQPWQLSWTWWNGVKLLTTGLS